MDIRNTKNIHTFITHRAVFYWGLIHSLRLRIVCVLTCSCVSCLLHSATQSLPSSSTPALARECSCSRRRCSRRGCCTRDARGATVRNKVIRQVQDVLHMPLLAAAVGGEHHNDSGNIINNRTLVLSFPLATRRSNQLVRGLLEHQTTHKAKRSPRMVVVRYELG